MSRRSSNYEHTATLRMALSILHEEASKELRRATCGLEPYAAESQEFQDGAAHALEFILRGMDTHILELDERLDKLGRSPAQLEVIVDNSR